MKKIINGIYICSLKSLPDKNILLMEGRWICFGKFFKLLYFKLSSSSFVRLGKNSLRILFSLKLFRIKTWKKNLRVSPRRYSWNNSIFPIAYITCMSFSRGGGTNLVIFLPWITVMFLTKGNFATKSFRSSSNQSMSRISKFVMFTGYSKLGKCFLQVILLSLKMQVLFWGLALVDASKIDNRRTIL